MTSARKSREVAQGCLVQQGTLDQLTVIDDCFEIFYDYSIAQNIKYTDYR